MRPPTRIVPSTQAIAGLASPPLKDFKVARNCREGSATANIPARSDGIDSVAPQVAVTGLPTTSDP